METKDQQVAFLKLKLDEAIRNLLVNEPRYRALRSKTMSAKPSQALLAEETRAKLNKDMLESEVRNIRGLIQEIEKGEFNV